MSFKDEALNLLKLVQEFRSNKDKIEESKVASNCFILDDNIILQESREFGNTRYPYSKDGLTIWANANGYFSINESSFHFIPETGEGKEPYTGFFAGIRNEDNTFKVISLTEVSKRPHDEYERFTVFKREAAYYFTIVEKIVFVLRVFMSEKKEPIFSVIAINTGRAKKDIYFSTYLNFILMHAPQECFETKWFRKASLTEDGALFESVEDIDRNLSLYNFAVVNRVLNINKIKSESHTTSKSEYTGSTTLGIYNATTLEVGKFGWERKVTQFTDSAILGDIYGFTLSGSKDESIDYIISLRFNKDEALSLINRDLTGYADNQLESLKKTFKEPSLKMTFDDGKNYINAKLLTKFLRSVEGQVEFAALAKNSGVSLLGVRDVAQQIEACLMFKPDEARSKILEILNFTDPSGRLPRQYSIPRDKEIPQMDTRAFIDQGVWVINALYRYLSFTGDYSILKETCGYFKIVGRNKVEYTDLKDSVYMHLIKITDYLVNNIDKTTSCVKALYGDWNDALDGLGVTSDPKKEFGNGVSVMTTLQLYENLDQVVQIIGKFNNDKKLINKYNKVRKTIEKGILKNAIDSNEDQLRILHGWGDNRSYKVGSFNDPDGESRDSLTVNAFFVLSGMINVKPEMRDHILGAYLRLSSKYGFKTFEPYFKRGTKGVGRIVNLPKGTAENAATYVHGALFGIWSLFRMNEPDYAFNELYKVLPITHRYISTTPSIMSNSYGYNQDLGIDGESMNDWFTGSANVLIKMMVFDVFGFTPNLSGITIRPLSHIPFKSASLSVIVKGKLINLTLKEGKNESVTFNGLPLALDNGKVFIDDYNLKDKNTIVITFIGGNR